MEGALFSWLRIDSRATCWLGRVKIILNKCSPLVGDLLHTINASIPNYNYFCFVVFSQFRCKCICLFWAVTTTASLGLASVLYKYFSICGYIKFGKYPGQIFCHWEWREWHPKSFFFKSYTISRYDIYSAFPKRPGYQPSLLRVGFI